MMLGSPQVKCGEYSSETALCGADSREFQYQGNAEYKALTGWLKPSGM
jgi:hypothetical protein